MKQKFSSLFATIILVISFVFFSQSQVNAMDITPGLHVDSPNINVKYIGMDEGFVKFKVTISNATKNGIVLRINDQQGLELYRESITGVYSKTIKIAISEVSKVNFLIKSEEVELNKSFTIQPETIQTVNVTELR